MTVIDPGETRTNLPVNSIEETSKPFSDVLDFKDMNNGVTEYSNHNSKNSKQQVQLKINVKNSISKH